MSTNPSKHEVDRQLKKLFESIVNLGNQKVPCVAIVYAKGKIEHFGTKMINKNTQNLINCSCLCNCEQRNYSLLEVFRKEQLSIIDSSEDAFDKDVIETQGILNFISITPKSFLNFQQISP
jgi:hypothetical protein